LPDLERRAVTKFRLSFSEFWDSTPRELDLLMEQSAYYYEFEMNKVRHLMSVHINLNRKKGTRAKSVKEIMPLPLIDGNKKSRNELLE
jgi:hypothetical protein